MRLFMTPARPPPTPYHTYTAAPAPAAPRLTRTLLLAHNTQHQTLLHQQSSRPLAARTRSPPSLSADPSSLPPHFRPSPPRPRPSTLPAPWHLHPRNACSRSLALPHAWFRLLLSRAPIARPRPPCPARRCCCEPRARPAIAVLATPRPAPSSRLAGSAATQHKYTPARSPAAPTTPNHRASRPDLTVRL